MNYRVKLIYLHSLQVLFAAVMQLTAVESALSSLHEAVTTAPQLYGLPKQMQQLSRVNY